MLRMRKRDLSNSGFIKIMAFLLISLFLINIPSSYLCFQAGSAQEMRISGLSDEFYYDSNEGDASDAW